MPAQSSEANIRNIIGTSPHNIVSNVTIEGINLKSVNSTVGTGYYINSLTSYVQGIFIRGSDNLNIKNVRMDNLSTGLKLGWGTNNQKNTNVTVDNLNVYNAGTALLMSSTVNFTMTNSVLDASAGRTRWLHSAYIDADNDNLYFNNVKFINSPGNAVTIGTSWLDRSASVNITFENSLFENSRLGFGVFGSSPAISKNITLLNSKIRNTGLPVVISQSTGIHIRNVDISVQKLDTDASGIFHISNTNNVRISDVTVNAQGFTNGVFAFREVVDDVIISRANIVNIPNIRTFFNISVNNPATNVFVNDKTTNVLVENSRFEWANITMPRITFPGLGSSVTFRNNHFINHGVVAPSLSNNPVGTNIVLDGNFHSGFTSLSHPSDHATIINSATAVVPPVVEPIEPEEVVRRQLEIQIQELQVKIKHLKAEIARTLKERGIVESEILEIPEPLIDFAFERNLYLGATGEDVRKLQIFLNLNPETRLTETGSGSPRNETLLFGPLTRNALIRFQEKHRQEILTPSGLIRATGFFGPRTRNKINEMLIGREIRN